jgi:hypothetical protein
MKHAIRKLFERHVSDARWSQWLPGVSQRIARCGMSMSAMVVLAILPWAVQAQVNGTWKNDSSGNWSDATKWVSSIATGANAFADFSTVNITDHRTVTNDVSGWTIGHLRFSDTSIDSNTKSWTLEGSGNVLYLSTGGIGTPSIATRPNSNGGDVANINTILAGSEGLEITNLYQSTASYKNYRPVNLSVANIYTGTTTVKSNAYLQLSHDRALADTPLVVEYGGRVNLMGAGRRITNAFTLANMAIISSLRIGSSGPTGFTTNAGPIGISGTVTIAPEIYMHIVVDGAISETQPGASILLGSFRNDGNRGSITLKRANTYSGTTVVSRSAIVYLEHADAFGTATNTVAINGTGTDSNIGQLIVRTVAGTLNPAKSLSIGSYGYFRQEGGTLITNTIYLNGGTLGCREGAGSVATNISQIVLGAGTESTFDRTAGGGKSFYQLGTISGSGGIYLTGYDGNDSSFYYRGANSFTGGVRIAEKSASSRNYVGSDTAFSTGRVLLQAAASNAVLCTLEKSLTMANTFAGTGKIATGTFTNTVTGGLAPGTGSNTSAIVFDRLKFGSDTQGARYDWKFAAASNDVVVASAELKFGQTTHTVNCTWVGSGSALAGDYVLFSYAGTDPDLTGVSWTVNAPAGLAGTVSRNTTTKRIMITLKPGNKGTLIMMR